MAKPISIRRARRGFVSTLDGVYRDCNRQQFMVRTMIGWSDIFAGDVLVNLFGLKFVIKSGARNG